MAGILEQAEGQRPDDGKEATEEQKMKKAELARIKAAETKAKTVLTTYQTAMNCATTFLSAMDTMPEW
eukprot:4307099-Pyramimonas_sp.AAC.1